MEIMMQFHVLDLQLIWTNAHYLATAADQSPLPHPYRGHTDMHPYNKQVPSFFSSSEYLMLEFKYQLSTVFEDDEIFITSFPFYILLIKNEIHP